MMRTSDNGTTSAMDDDDARAFVDRIRKSARAALDIRVPRERRKAVETIRDALERRLRRTGCPPGIDRLCDRLNYAGDMRYALRDLAAAADDLIARSYPEPGEETAPAGPVP